MLQFTDNLRNSHGQYSDKVVGRCSQLVGSLGKAVEAVYTAEVIRKQSYSAKTKRVNTKTSVINFVNEYQDDGLFHHVAGRRHSAFPDFRNQMTIDKPDKLRGRFIKYSHKLNAERSVQHEYRTD
jgi:hypothetical protein